ncbi:MAG: sulfurtransferase-like selenium metabolism protein YedF [Clostridia bacterium]|nr:sulfurtransferase-like selenium metabolism protein YedF [Clostridia bacterium]
MQTTVDARGLGCPVPVIKTKKALDNIASGNVLTIVDNEVAKENVTKLVRSMNLECHVVEDGGEYYIDINKNAEAEITVQSSGDLFDSVVLAASDKFGEGDPDLGDILVKGYFYTLSEMDIVPKTIIFLNSGVKLAVEGSKILKDLKALETKGVEIISCGTCLDFYQLTSSLAVGGISNMFTIAEHLNNAKKVIRL